MNHQQYIGIIYNWKGLKEENYIYTKEEIQSLDPELYKDCLSNPHEWHDSTKVECPWKTWMGTLLREEQIEPFLKGAYNDIECMIPGERCIEGWYWENVIDNDLYGIKSNTMKNILEKYDLLKMKGE